MRIFARKCKSVYWHFIFFCNEKKRRKKKRAGSLFIVCPENCCKWINDEICPLCITRREKNKKFKITSSASLAAVIPRKLKWQAGNLYILLLKRSTHQLLVSKLSGQFIFNHRKSHTEITRRHSLSMCTVIFWYIFIAWIDQIKRGLVLKKKESRYGIFYILIRSENPSWSISWPE